MTCYELYDLKTYEKTRKIDIIVEENPEQQKNYY